MSLNNEQMLPERVRKMRQMEDLLNAEDLVLAQIERIIEEMYAQAALLHEELVNEEWLEAKLLELTGSVTEVTGDAENLLVDVLMDVSEMDDLELEDVRAFLDKWLPAHLQYRLRYLMSYAGERVESFLLYRMAICLDSLFWPVRTLDGTWLLDGEFLLDAVRKSDDCGMGYGIGETGHEETAVFRLAAFLKTYLNENCLPVLAGVHIRYDDALPAGSVYQAACDAGETTFTEDWDGGVRITRDYWFLDGTYLLNGKKLLDSMQIEEGLT